MSSEQIWPEGIRCAAVFTFDNDDEFGMIDAFGSERMFYVSQGYYDTNEGTARVLRILKRHQVRATFCMVGRTAEKRQDIVKMIREDGHEVAAHSWDHRPYYKMEYEEEREDIQKTLDIVERMVGTRPVGHRSPDWNPSKSTVKILHELGGFIWRGDSLDGDLPYIHKFEDGRNIVELPSSIGLDDFGVYGDRGYSPQEAFELWKDEFDILYEEGKFFCLTAHPLVSGRPAPSTALEKIVAYVKSHDGVWISTAQEIAKYWLSKSQAALIV